jgi:hypothetical protein
MAARAAACAETNPDWDRRKKVSAAAVRALNPDIVAPA